MKNKQKELEFMQELHKIREELTREWKRKPWQEISSHLRRVAKEFKAKRLLTHH